MSCGCYSWLTEKVEMEWFEMIWKIDALLLKNKKGKTNYFFVLPFYHLIETSITVVLSLDNDNMMKNKGGALPVWATLRVVHLFLWNLSCCFFFLYHDNSNRFWAQKGISEATGAGAWNVHRSVHAKLCLQYILLDQNAHNNATPQTR